MDIISFLLFICAAGICAFFRFSAPLWSLILAGILLVYAMFSLLSWIILFPLAIVTFALIFLFNSTSHRKRWMTAFVMKKLLHLLPSMTQTEKEALDAGDTWIEQDIFQGKIDWDNLSHASTVQLTPDETAFIETHVKKLCQQLDDWKIVQEDQELPTEIWQYMKAAGFFGLAIAKAYGGLGFSAYAQSCIVSMVASRSLTVAVTIMVPNSLGPGELLYHYGTSAQKDYYLPRLAKGKDLPCFALTAPTAGSDAAAIPDVGVITKGEFEGKEIIGIRLNFDKRYITLAPVATLMGLAFKLYDPERLLGDKAYLGITVCLLPMPYPGITADTRHLPMRVAFMNGPIRGQDVFVPLDWIIGGSAMIGQGWRMLMECLSMGRGISLPALATAVGKVALFSTGAYAKIRQQFNVSIGAFEGVQAGLARILASTYILEANRVMIAQAVSAGKKPAVASAIAKYHMTEMSRHVLNDAMDIHAGKAIQMGPHNYLAHAYLGLPISITVEGANILTRNLIIFGQGAMRCHPYIRDEIEAAQQGDLTRFDRLLCQHLAYVAANFAKTFFHGLTAGYFIAADRRHPLFRYRKKLARMSTAFSLTADITMMLLGGELKRRESLSARLGDILSHLYLALGVMSYFDRETAVEDEVATASWALESCLHEIQNAFDGLLQNYPKPWLARCLTWVIFPFDRSFKNPPKDELSATLALASMKRSILRERLTQYCYIGDKASEPLYALDQALSASLAAAPVEKKLAKAMKAGTIDKQLSRAARLSQALEKAVLTEAEVMQLREQDIQIFDILRVDEFPVSQFTQNEKRSTAVQLPQFKESKAAETVNTLDIEN